MPKYTPERIQAIRGHLSQLRRGACSVAELAASIGVSAWTIYCWKRRFDSDAGFDCDIATTKPRTCADLIEIESPIAREPIEIAIGPVTIRVPSRCDVEDLQSVLQTVLRC
jgi:hypothetical protein